MIRGSTFAGRMVAVVGLGASGLATARALMAGGAGVAAWDDGAAGRDAASAAGIPVVDLQAADWSQFSSLVLAPGIPLTHPVPHWSVDLARGAGIEVIGDVEIFFRERAALMPEAAVVAITGTNGKSTTTALVAHVLRTSGRDAQLGGNIGVPVLALEPFGEGRIYVLELSSFQIDLTPSLAPTVGVLLNITPDHLDRHGPADDIALSMANYAAIKERVVASAKLAVVGVEDGLRHDGEATRQIVSRIVAAERPVVMFTRKPSPVTEAAYAEHGVLKRAISIGGGYCLGEVLCDLRTARALRGDHNGENAAAAFLACEWLGVPHDQIGAGLKSYPGLPHRMEEVGTLANGAGGRVLFINDSKATNADSTEKALSSFPGDIYWIAGGKAKEGGIAPLAAYFNRIAKAYLIGASTEDFAETLEGRTAFERCGTLDAALAAALRDACTNAATESIVLLSPACASYDQFRSFEHRGDTFRDLVLALPEVVARGTA